MMPSLVASTWKDVSRSQAAAVLKGSNPLEDCQFQLGSRFQRWRTLLVLLRQRIWLVPARVSAATICHSLLSLPTETPEGALICWRAPATSTKAMPSPRLSSLELPCDSRVVSSLRIVPTTPSVVPMLYPVPAARVRVMVSSGSNSTSTVGSTVTVVVAELAANVSVLVAGVASMPV